MLKSPERNPSATASPGEDQGRGAQERLRDRRDADERVADGPGEEAAVRPPDLPRPEDEGGTRDRPHPGHEVRVRDDDDDGADEERRATDSNGRHRARARDLRRRGAPADASVRDRPRGTSASGARLLRCGRDADGAPVATRSPSSGCAPPISRPSRSGVASAGSRTSHDPALEHDRDAVGQRQDLIQLGRNDQHAVPCRRASR